MPLNKFKKRKENDIYTSGPYGPLVLRYLCRYIEMMVYPLAMDRLDLTGH